MGPWQGVKRWQRADRTAKVVSLNRDTIFAINQQQRLVMLERANGQQRRILSDLPLVEAVSVYGNRGYVHGRHTNGQQFLAAVGLHSGTVHWQRSIPVGTEVRDTPSAHQGGVTLELVSRGYRPSLLTFNRDGELQGIGDPSEGDMISLPQGALISNEGGIQMISSRLPEKAAAIPAFAFGAKNISKEYSAAVWDQLPWDGVDNARYALISQGGNLALAFEMGEGAEQIIARVGHSGPELDPEGQKLTLIRNRRPSLKSQRDGWRMKSYHRLTNGANGSWRGVVVLSPPVLVDPLRRPEIFISSNLDAQTGAWWLRRLWRPIEATTSTP